MRTIVAGDELQLIAQKHYNDSFLWPEMYCHPSNKGFRKAFPDPHAIVPGVKLSLPPKDDLILVQQGPVHVHVAGRDGEDVRALADQYYGDGSIWPLLRYAKANRGIWLKRRAPETMTLRAGDVLQVPTWQAPADVPGERRERVTKNARYMIYVHSKLMIVDDQYILLGSANLNERSLAGDRDTEICVSMWPSSTKVAKGCRARVEKLRGALFEEHYGGPPPSWKKPEDKACVAAMQGLADRNYVRLAKMEPLGGHLVRLPLVWRGNTLDIKTEAELGVQLGTSAAPDFLLDYDTTSDAAYDVRGDRTSIPDAWCE